MTIAAFFLVLIQGTGAYPAITTMPQAYASEQACHDAGIAFDRDVLPYSFRRGHVCIPAPSATSK
jgi:hypothetical protein